MNADARCRRASGASPDARLLTSSLFSPSRAPASNLLAYAIHAIMEVNPEYQEELAAAKAQLRQALELDAQAAK